MDSAAPRGAKDAGQNLSLKAGRKEKKAADPEVEMAKEEQGESLGETCDLNHAVPRSAPRIIVRVCDPPRPSYWNAHQNLPITRHVNCSKSRMPARHISRRVSYVPIRHFRKPLRQARPIWVRHTTVHPYDALVMKPCQANLVFCGRKLCSIC